MTHIKTWRERVQATGIGSGEARDDEIRELRQALAQPESEPGEWAAHPDFAPDWAGYRQGRLDGVVEAQSDAIAKKIHAFCISRKWMESTDDGSMYVIPEACLSGLADLLVDSTQHTNSVVFQKDAIVNDKSDREALIAKHRNRAENAKRRYANAMPAITADELLALLDMLEADAQKIARLKVAFGKLRRMAPEGLGIGLFIANTLEGL